MGGQNLQQQIRIAGIALAARGVPSFAEFGQGRWVDGIQVHVCVFAQHHRQGSPSLFQRHGQGLAPETHMQFHDPHFHCFGSVVQSPALEAFLPGRSETPVMLLIRPVDRHQGSELRFRLCFHDGLWYLLHALPFLRGDLIPTRALSPREPYSSLQTSRRYLRIRHGNKASPRFENLCQNVVRWGLILVTAVLPVELLYPISRPSTSHRTGRCDSLVWVFPQPARADYCGKPSIDPRPFGSTIRDSGYLAVSNVSVGGRLDKTGAVAGGCPGDEAVGKPRSQGVCEPALEPWRRGKGLWRKSQDFQPDRGNPAVRPYRGATGNVAMNPSCNRKSRNGNPPPKAGRARALSQTQRKRGAMDRPNLRSNGASPYSRSR